MKDTSWVMVAIASVLIMILCSDAVAGPLLRVYCLSDGSVSVEHRLDEDYNNENVVENSRWFVIDHEALPKAEYIEQLRCNGHSLTVDHSIKPERAVREEQIQQAQSALDAELGKAEPDVIAVLRLQRSIELLKEDKQK